VNYFSNNVQKIQISGIRRFFNKVAQYPDAISLTVGQPDFKVPEKIKKATIAAIEKDLTGYTSNIGIAELRTAISSYLNGYDISYSADETCITVGGSEGILAVMMALVNPNDKVLIPSIAYPAYESCVKLIGGEAIGYPLKSDFSIDFEALEELIQIKKPKILVVSYPSNPTGDTLSKDNRNRMFRLIKEENIIVLSDEMYSALTFEDEYYSLAQIAELRERVILVGGFSKTFSMTGLRIGYVCAAGPIMEQILKVHQYNVTCAPSIVQWGAYEGITSCLSEAEEMRQEFIKRRDYVYDRLVALGFQVNYPKGAFYIFPSIKSFGINSEEFCERLLREGQVAVVPGTAFGEGGEGYIRISFAYSMQQLEEGLNRLEKWLKTI